MSSSTAMIICRLDPSRKLDLDKLRASAFTELVDSEGRRSGWTGLGELLDTDNFFLALSDARYSGFSFRQDTRKPSGAVIRLQVAEKIKQEELEGKKIGSKRKKEIRNEIVERLTAQADFSPALIDCIWDNEKGRLYVGAASEKAAMPVLERFNHTFGMEPEIIAPELDMSEVFSAIQRGNGVKAAGYSLFPTGDANLSSGGEDKSAIAAQNNPAAIEKGLNDGLAITRISLEAEKGDDNPLYFTLSADLFVSNMRLTKPEKGADAEGTFLINAEICSAVADIVESLAAITPDS